MNDDFFPFAFLFQLHKSTIPIGISNTDAGQLAAVYGVPEERVHRELARIGQHNRETGARILRDAAPENAAERHLRVAFLGDSNTSCRTSYLQILQEAVELWPGWELLDFSVSGNKTDNLLYTLYPRVMDSRAQIAHIMIGTNDMRRIRDGSDLLVIPPEIFRRNLAHLTRVLKAQGAEVLLTTIPVFSPEKAKQSDKGTCSQYWETDRQEFNGIIRSIAAEYGAKINDMDPVYSAFTPETLTREDGIHLNDRGQELLARRVLRCLLSIAEAMDRMPVHQNEDQKGRQS